MSGRAVVAFVVGAVIFAVAPRFDTLLPVRESPSPIPVVVGLLGAVAVGALVFFIARERRLWWLAPASALAGALAANIFYEIFLQPPPRDGFELGAVLFGTFSEFLFTGLAAMVGVLLARFVFALADSRGQRQRRIN